MFMVMQSALSSSTPPVDSWTWAPEAAPEVLGPSGPTYYCTNGASLDDITHEECSSCRNRCSATNSMGWNQYCSCDGACFVYEDCCWDFQQACPEEHQAALTVLSQLQGSPRSTCVNSLPTEWNYSYRLVSECGSDPCAYLFHGDYVDPSLGVPFKDLDTGIVYVTYNCALCNGASRLEPMQVVLSCGDGTLQPSHEVWLAAGTTTERVTTTPQPAPDVTALLNAAMGDDCDILYHADQLGARRCHGVVDTCPDSCDNDRLKGLCHNSSFEAYTQVMHSTIYRNKYCAICATGYINSFDCSMLFFNPTSVNPSFGAYSLSLLFDFNPENGASVGSVTVTCSHDQVLLPDGVSCGDVVCPSGYTLQEGHCVAIGLNHAPDTVTSSSNSTMCAGVSIMESEFIHGTDNTLTVITTGHVYEAHEYILQNNSAILCYNESDYGGQVVLFSTANTLGITTIVLSSLSLLCLTIRILLQPVRKQYDTFPGRLQCNLVCAMALATALLLFSPLAVDVENLCAILAGFKYMAYLATFFWMTCVAANTWWVLRPSRACMPDNPHRSLLKHVLPTWLFPFIMLIVAYTLDHTDIPVKYRPQFGGLACWFTQRSALMYYFFVPVAICIVINTVLFILTSIALRQAFQNSASVRSTRGRSSEFRVYAKLFILMGLTWTVGFVAAWVNTEEVWYMFVCLNASQGIYIFIFFVLDIKWFVRVLCCCCRSFQNQEVSYTGSRSSKSYSEKNKTTLEHT